MNIPVFKFTEDIELTPMILAFWRDALKMNKEQDGFYLLPPFIDYLTDIVEDDDIELKE